MPPFGGGDDSGQEQEKEGDDKLTSEIIADVTDGASTKVLGFVRQRMRKLKAENIRLQDQVDDLSQTLGILQTAQNYGAASGNIPNEQKMQEVAMLLLEAKKAKQEAMEFSKIGKAALYEKLRVYKNMLYRERMEKREMRERLRNAFEQMKIMKEQHQQRDLKRKQEREAWQAIVRKIKVEHQREIARFANDSSLKQDRARQLGQFGERVMLELQQLQGHLDMVKKETVDQVELDEPTDKGTMGYDDALPSLTGNNHDSQFFITQR